MALRARARAGPVERSNRSIPSSDRLQRLRPPRVETDAGVAAARYSGAVEAGNCMRPGRIEGRAGARRVRRGFFRIPLSGGARQRAGAPPVAPWISPRDVE